MLRHVASRPGIGTAFVLDRRGADDVVIETGRDRSASTQPTEATHPSWSPDGRLVWSLGSRLQALVAGRRVHDRHRAASGRDRRVLAGVRGGGRHRGRGRASPSRGSTRHEDEGLDNLWRYELSDAPLVAHHVVPRHRRSDGRRSGPRSCATTARSSSCVVRGVASATHGCRRSSSGAYRRRGVASEVRGLPREMYLAGEPGRAAHLEHLRPGERRVGGSYSESSVTTARGSRVRRRRGRPASTSPDLTTLRPEPARRPHRADRRRSRRAPRPHADAPSSTRCPTPRLADRRARSGRRLRRGDPRGRLREPGSRGRRQSQTSSTSFGGSDAVLEVVDSIDRAEHRPARRVGGRDARCPTASDPLAALGDFRSRLPAVSGLELGGLRMRRGHPSDRPWSALAC